MMECHDHLLDPSSRTVPRGLIEQRARQQRTRRIENPAGPMVLPLALMDGLERTLGCSHQVAVACHQLFWCQAGLRCHA